MGKLRAFFAVAIVLTPIVACGWDPSKPFEREAPSVNEAIRALDAGDATAAVDKLEEYLSTGQCAEGSIGTPELVKKRANGSFDLGLSLFAVSESFGQRFGDEENDAGLPEAKQTQRKNEIECGLRIVRAFAIDPDAPIDLRARARYLEGNLLFLDSRYEDAVSAYDQALTLVPGEHAIDAGDGGGKRDESDAVGRDAAWNRAIALRRIEDKKDAGNDAGEDAHPDSSPPDASPPDAANDANDSGQDSGNGDSGNDKGDAGNDGGAGDAGSDGASPKPQDQQQDAGTPPPPPKQNQDERMLDQLENAPTVQQEAAKKQAQKRRVRGMEDK